MSKSSFFRAEKLRHSVQLLVTCALFLTAGLASPDLPHARAAEVDPCPTVFAHSQVEEGLEWQPVDLARLSDARQPMRVAEAEIAPALFTELFEDSKKIVPQVGVITDFKNYIQDLHQIQDKLQAHSPRSHEVDSVFYPLMGTDLALPLLLFPNAKTIVTYDVIPFMKLYDAEHRVPIQVKSAIGGAWRAAAHIEDEGSNLERTLGALFDAFEHLKILSLETKITHRPENPKSPYVSGRLKFDLEDGVGERTLIYLNQHLSPHSKKVDETLAAVWRFQPKAAIFKASMGLGESSTGETSLFGHRVIDFIRSRHGVILEGLARGAFKFDDKPGVHYPELHGKITTNKDGSVNLHPDARSYILLDHPFGYDKGVLVTDFEQI